MAECVRDLGRYRLVAEIARGGMGDVYLSIIRGPVGFNKLAVVKALRAELAEDPHFLSMFLDEARLAAQLSHPNVVQTNEVGKEEDVYFLAMEYLEGQTLQRLQARLVRKDKLPTLLQLRILSEVLAGLHYAHDLVDCDGRPLGIVHRDVTPQNIFVTYDGHVKLVDFGIAKARGATRETEEGVVKGKVAYMSPEQGRGEAVDRRTDLFAVGVLLFEAATGRRFWEGVEEMVQLRRLLEGDLPKIEELTKSIPAELRAILTRALAPRPDDRYATAAELQAAIDGYLEGLGDERASTKVLRELLTTEFAQERASMRATIDAHLRALRTVAPADFENVGMLQLSGGRVRVASASGSGNREDARPSSPSDVGERTSETWQTAPSVPATPRALAEIAAHARWRRPRRVALTASVAVAVAAIGAWYALHRGADPPASAAGPPRVETSPAPLVEARTEIRFRASPDDAALFLDGRPLGANPYVGSSLRDGLAHRLSAEARGHRPKESVVTFDRDVSIDLALDRDLPPVAPAPPRRAPPRPVAAAASPRAAQAAPSPSVATSHPPPPSKRTIDVESPYAR